jgi:hypothetical protein
MPTNAATKEMGNGVAHSGGSMVKTEREERGEKRMAADRPSVPFWFLVSVDSVSIVLNIIASCWPPFDQLPVHWQGVPPHKVNYNPIAPVMRALIFSG